MNTAYVKIEHSSVTISYEKTDRITTHITFFSYEDLYNHIKELIERGWNIKLAQSPNLLISKSLFRCSDI